MPKRKPTDDEIRDTAYHMWIEDGAPHGDDQAYWFKAEQALIGAAPKKASAKKATAKKATAKTPAAKKTAARKAPAKKAPAKKAAAKKAAAKS